MRNEKGRLAPITSLRKTSYRLFHWTDDKEKEDDEWSGKSRGRERDLGFEIGDGMGWMGVGARLNCRLIIILINILNCEL